MFNPLAPIVHAMTSTVRAAKAEDEQRKAALTAIVARLYSLRGQGGDPAALSAPIALAVSELDKEIMLKYPWFTLAEIRYALEEGIKGTWDTDQTKFQGGTGLTVANYCRWLSDYRYSRARLEAEQAVAEGKRITDPSCLLAPEDIARKNAEYLKRTIDLFKSEIHETGVIDASHWDGRVANVYDALRKDGTMSLPEKSVIDAAMKRAASDLRQGTEREKLILRAKRYLLQDYLRALDPGAPVPVSNAGSIPAGPLTGFVKKVADNITAA